MVFFSNCIISKPLKAKKVNYFSNFAKKGFQYICDIITASNIMLSQIKEEDESKTSSRNSMDKEYSAEKPPASPAIRIENGNETVVEAQIEQEDIPDEEEDECSDYPDSLDSGTTKPKEKIISDKINNNEIESSEVLKERVTRK